jgi:hypothetical protein
MTIALTLQKYLAASVATQLWHKERVLGAAHRHTALRSFRLDRHLDPPQW